MTAPQLRVIIDGHARAEALSAARSMVAVRVAVWADESGFRHAMADLRENRR